MSRSRKKIPIGWLCSGDHGKMKKWKNQNDKSLRSIEGEIPSGSFYKKMNDPWSSPSDGKSWYNHYPPEEKWKAYRK